VLVPSSLPPDRTKSACSVALESRLLASTMPAVNGGSPTARGVMAATGSDSGAAVNSCILDAERRLTPSGLLVFVSDLFRAFVTLLGLFPGAGPAAMDSVEGGPRDGSPSLWLSLDGSGVGTPLVGLDTFGSREVVDPAGGVGRGSLGVRIGDGSWVAVCCEPFLFLVPRPSLSDPQAEAAVEASEVSMFLCNGDQVESALPFALLWCPPSEKDAVELVSHYQWPSGLRDILGYLSANAASDG
jgi:hypothetical protein